MPEMKVCNRCAVLHQGTGARCSACDVPRRRNRSLSASQQGTLERKIYRSREWRTVRALAIERDNRECRLCHGTEDLVVHHHEEISAESDPFNLDNLETLCRACHGKLHALRKRERAAAKGG